jgi:serine/threonine protein phosphatase 1
MRTLAIGDVHGCAKQLDRVLDAIQLSTDDHVVFLGDLVDRGPDSAAVLTQIVRLRRSHRVTVILGNHEQMMLAARESHDRLTDWLMNGGDQTLQSYAGFRATLRDVPGEHWDLVERGTVDYLETDTHLFVHANVDPNLELADQPDYMLRWERCDRIAPHESGKTIVCGHTPQRSGRVMNKGFAICIDTDACRGGPLTCLDAGSGRVWQATPDGRVHRAHIGDFGEDDGPGD